MKILLIAQDFRPSASPQSLRWQYLARELAALGHEMHVLTAAVVPMEGAGLPTLPDEVRIHRSFSGPLAEYKAWRHRRRSGGNPGHAVGAERSCADIGGQKVALPRKRAQRPQSLNWKGKLWNLGGECLRAAERILDKVFSRCLFPDERAEWLPWGRRRLRGLLKEVSPDVVVSSHEPATSLMLGLHAARRGYDWVVDLGDPVCASYTMNHWRRRAMKLEGQVCQDAGMIFVTTAAMKDVLEERHGKRARTVVIPQGFDASASRVAPVPRKRSDPLILLYTGSFYDFRTCDALLDAVISTPGVVLEVATVRAPTSLVCAARDYPESVKILGFIPHDEAIIRQAAAHVLINIGNAMSEQIPGKIYEYLGAERPILHISSLAEREDSAWHVIDGVRRGIRCMDSPGEIADVLARLTSSDEMEVDFKLDLSSSAVARYSWESAACKIDGELMMNFK